MASALEQFVNNVRQLSAQGRATKVIRGVVLARQLAYAIIALPIARQPNWQEPSFCFIM